MIEISLFPTCPIPYNKTFKYDIPPIEGIHSFDIDLSQLPVSDVRVELAKYSIACSGYYEDDFLNISINGIIIEDTWYTREIMEDEEIGNSCIVYSIPINSIIHIEFNNALGLTNILWFKINLLHE